MVSAASGAAPEKKPLMKERSISRNSGSASRPTKMVGTPGRKSGLSFLSISMTPAGSGRGIMQCSQACQMKKFWQAVKPAAWKTGKVPTSDIPPRSRSGNQAANCCTLQLMLAWLSITPLLTPVVPPV